MTLKERVERLGIKVEDIMAEFGLGKSTVYAIVNGTYTGKKEVAAAVEEYIADRENGATKRSDGWETLDQKAMAVVLSYAYDYGELTVIAGPSGIGKTEAAKRFVAKNDRVLHYKCVEGLGWSNTLSEIAELVGAPQAGTCSAKMKRIMKALKGGNCKLLIIDEVEHLITNTVQTNNFLRRIAFFRELNEYAKIGVTIIGLELLETELRHAAKTYLSNRVLNLLTAKTPSDKELRSFWENVCGMTWDATAKGLLERVRERGSLRTLEHIKTMSTRVGGNVEAALRFVFI